MVYIIQRLEGRASPAQGPGLPFRTSCPAIQLCPRTDARSRASLYAPSRYRGRQQGAGAPHRKTPDCTSHRVPAVLSVTGKGERGGRDTPFHCVSSAHTDARAVLQHQTGSCSRLPRIASLCQRTKPTVVRERSKYHRCVHSMYHIPLALAFAHPWNTLFSKAIP